MYIKGRRLSLVGQQFKAFGATLFRPTSAGEITASHRFKVSPTPMNRNSWDMGLAHYR